MDIEVQKWSDNPLRQENIRSTLLCLRDSGPLSVVSVAKIVGISRPTAQSILYDLQEQGFVAEQNADLAGQRSVGRPAKVYSFVAKGEYLVAVDLGLHTLHGRLVDISGTVIVSAEVVTPGKLTSDERLDLVEGLVKQMAAEAATSLKELRVIVFSVPGIVDDAGKVILSNPVPEWTGVNLGQVLGRRLGNDVIVENDINLAALAEHSLGVAKGSNNVFYLHVGHRMNAGLILGGQLYRGKNFSAGEIADIEELQFFVFGEDTDNLSTTSAARDLIDAVERGDEGAEGDLSKFASQVALTIAPVSAALDPDMVVIGGGLSQAGEVLVEPIRKAVEKLVPSRRISPMETSTFGASGTVLGALVRAFQVFNAARYGTESLPRKSLEWE